MTLSIHSIKAWRVARAKGAWAGGDLLSWESLAAMSKRELIEIALRLGARAAGECDSPGAGFDRVIEERNALRANGLI